MLVEWMQCSCNRAYRVMHQPQLQSEHLRAAGSQGIKSFPGSLVLLLDLLQRSSACLACGRCGADDHNDAGQAGAALSCCHHVRQGLRALL